MEKPVQHLVHRIRHCTHQKRSLFPLRRGVILAALLVVLVALGLSLWVIRQKSNLQQHRPAHKQMLLPYGPIIWRDSPCSGFCMRSPIGLIQGGIPITFTWVATTHPIACYLLAYYRSDQTQIHPIIVPKDRTRWTIAPLPPGYYGWQLIADTSQHDCTRAEVTNHPPHIWSATGGFADTEMGPHTQARFTVTAPTCTESGGECMDGITCMKQCQDPKGCACVSSYPDCASSLMCQLQN